MTWINRLRLFGAIVAVLVVVGLLTILFNQRQNVAQSVSAQIEQPSYTLGSDYGGVVTNQKVKVGDSITEGQELFTISSVSLQQDVANDIRPVSTDAMTFDLDKGTITFYAVQAGYVSNLDAVEGSYVNTGSKLATVTETNPRVAVAYLKLSPRDYGRLEKGATAEIQLPNNERVSGTVDTASVTTEQGEAVAEVRITSTELDAAKLDLVATDGAPVQVDVNLKDTGILAGPTDAVMDFLRKVGLR